MLYASLFKRLLKNINNIAKNTLNAKKSILLIDEYRAYRLLEVYISINSNSKPENILAFIPVTKTNIDSAQVIITNLILNSLKVIKIMLKGNAVMCNSGAINIDM